MASPDPDDYLARIGLDRSAVENPDLDALRTLQRAHVTSVPFETLAVTGDPHGPGDGEGVTLTLPHLYEKVVERERGGFCFELNGLFGWLLAELGFDADRIAAGMLSDDGDPRPPANHHAHLVTLDRPYVVDVGCGVPTMRRPTPLDGSARTDAAGVAWRVVESDRPDATYMTQYQQPDDDEWNDRYVFDTAPRKLSYFEATCEYLSTAPESGFTGDPTVSVATERGHLKLSPEKLTRSEGGRRAEREVDPEEYHDLLEAEFGLRYGPA
ncbi:arylamine N-acetyltransferase family protein [Halorussus sp. AFM4]|uniref:arylamine N-acetyltransferase family protein n=1 Tax=Halorussus sp. AFM4 TaxID=3421651 RepID=UPI003EBFF363